MQDQQHLSINIADSGIGIEPQQQQAIFELFQQADMAFNRRFGGMGIGLPICQLLAQSMKAKLELRSQPNKGSTFSLVLPVHPQHSDTAQLPTQPARRRPTCSPYRVLIVEDNAVNMMVQKSLVEKMGYSVFTAGDGDQALQLLAQQPVDLILMDCQMPVMDGFEATRCIRRQTTEHADIPIIAITANATSGDRSRCLNAGMDDHIAKPISLTKLQSVLKHWLTDDAE